MNRYKLANTAIKTSCIEYYLLNKKRLLFFSSNRIFKTVCNEGRIVRLRNIFIILGRLACSYGDRVKKGVDIVIFFWDIFFGSNE